MCNIVQRNINQMTQFEKLGENWMYSLSFLLCIDRTQLEIIFHKQRLSKFTINIKDIRS